jgi:beta-N-acetylhexosaminidase
VRARLLPAAVTAAVLVATGAGGAGAANAVSLHRLAGQLVISPMSGARPDAELLAHVRAGEVGGVILFGANIRSAAALRALTAELQRAAAAGGNPPLLVAVDQEGGPVRRLRSAPPVLSAPEMGRGSVASVRLAGELTGRALRAAGVNVDLAPVADVPRSPRSFMLERSFGSDPERVASLARAFVAGLQHERVAATAKHFPGLGTAIANTDARAVTIHASRAELIARLEPFRAAIAAGVELVMVSNAAYRALDPSGLPAVLSPRIVAGLLRETLGFGGVVITDTLAAPGPAAFPDAPVRTISAGGDVLLYTTSEADAARGAASLVAAVRSGRLSRARLEASYARVVALKQRLAG